MVDEALYKTRDLHLPFKCLGTMRWKPGRWIGREMHNSILAAVSRTMETVPVYFKVQLVPDITLPVENIYYSKHFY